ncbi:MAG: RnfABCDGE type electron transport complex subunit D, partial [Oscillospiraceae bacterium]|nr:RnfABCDGE type electron transport complex subunit D [Oscillospiraceae bacterium]
MKLHAQNPPHIRTRESNSTFMTDAIIATLPLYAMATYFYGTRVLIIAALSVLITVLVDAFCQMLKRSVPNIRDGSAIVTGLIIPLLMPASARIETVAVAAIFAITVVKHPFGGAG